mgnify:CR=1 FL=1
MPLDYPTWGVGDVPSYQLSAIPFVTSSAGTEVGIITPIKVTFPSVTRFVIISNTDANGGDTLRIGFTAAGVSGSGGYNSSAADRSNYFLLNAGFTTGRMEIRCKELFFLSAANTTGFSIMAGLTPINNNQYPILTGSAGYDGVG